MKQIFLTKQSHFQITKQTQINPKNPLKRNPNYHWLLKFSWIIILYTTPKMIISWLHDVSNFFIALLLYTSKNIEDERSKSKTSPNLLHNAIPIFKLFDRHLFVSSRPDRFWLWRGREEENNGGREKRGRWEDINKTKQYFTQT